MNKKLKIALIIVGVALLSVLLYFGILHPRVKLLVQTLRVYSVMGGTMDIGDPILAYEKYDVKDDTFKIIDYGNYSVGVPSHWTDQSDEGSTFITYGLKSTTDEDVLAEALAATGNGEDYTDMILLNREIYESDDIWRRVNKGFERLGYGMPTTAYDSIRIALSMDSKDYNLLNYNKSLAFTFALPYRAGSVNVYDGVTSWSYLYEDENKCGFINEMYREDSDSYRYYLNFYDTDDLNTEYIIILATKDKDTAYAIINSLEFKD